MTRAASGGPIVVGVDGSDASVRALGWAIEEALARGSEVRAIAVWSVDVTHDFAWKRVEDIRARYERLLDDAIAAAARGRAELPTIVPVVLEGPASTVLVEAARRAALLVVARHRDQKLRKTILGSVSAACAKNASVPVVVVPPRAQDEQGADAWRPAEPASVAGASTGSGRNREPGEE
ncbi:nucleotide-binding universal stress UspA family protein [Saccharomonospora amisosensis]|uniref:Nucleotide-binding universal stress UspA family protein n=1 Tax=Saccharomonospora amisosensis TaxID=1128677 RepID=A0A7X5UR14_9PSEU|nr:universal stress protein [Saccharomonospora amisosensis]NIJ12307.1 nucleotide-binding universal stress UspA family protein [Saccharomonospora amisosensis]